MSQTLYSETWYRVAPLKPRLRSHAQIHRHVYRGEVWYVLQDHASGRFHRFTPIANLVIGLLDGKRTVGEIWDIALQRLGTDVPPQDEIIKLLADLHRADVLQSDIAPDLVELGERREMHRKIRFKQYFGNPTALRFPLLDPNRFLDRIVPALRPLFGWGGAILWCLIVATGFIMGAMNWSGLSSGALDRVFSLENLFLMWLVFPLVKTAHEFGHAITVKAGGGEVHEMGIMLLLLMPIPYVDASAASAFRDKRWRMLVGASGMLVELAIAALAVVAWVYLPPGVPRAMAYNTLLITGVSTLVFNGNPLLRYDGYYILADYLEIPNFGQRASDYVGYLAKRFLFGVNDIEAPMTAKGERGWFIFYAPASLAYRMFIMITIVLVVSSRLYVIGVLLAFWCIYSMMGMPLTKVLSGMAFDPSLRRHRVRMWTFVGACVMSLVVVVLLVPFPSTTRSEGVIWASPAEEVRAQTDGFVSRVVATPNQRVRRGDVLVELNDPELTARVNLLSGQVDELQDRYEAATVQSRVASEIVQQQLVEARAALDLAKKRFADLVVRSPSDGIFVLSAPSDFPNRFVERGDIFAYVTSAVDSVRVVVPQASEDLVHGDTVSVSIRAADQIDEVIPARIEREVPAATNDLPSMALSLQGGGKIGLDPEHASEGKTIEKVFVLDLAIPKGTNLTHLGSRVYVRFEHRSEPLGVQWYREARRTFLKRFNV